jgi:methionyl-tRNA formyltransferase
MKNKDLKFIFWGTPGVASETLEILKNNGYLPMLIVTAPDKPQGRKMILTPPPVKTWAIENNVPFIQPENKINADEILQNTDLTIDLFIVVAYGKILSEEIINMPKFGSLNIHYSILPKHRGASPVESAILNNEKETGVTIQKMVYKMDAGPIIAIEKTEIHPEEKTEELRKRLIQIGGNLLVEKLPLYLDNKIELTEQIEQDATFCKKIKKEDGLVDLEKEKSADLYAKFKAYYKWPKTFFFDKNNKRIIITEANLENDKFVIKKVIPEGKKEIDFKKYKENII